MNDRKTDGGKGDRIPGANQSAYEAGYAGIQWGDGVDGTHNEQPAEWGTHSLASQADGAPIKIKVLWGSYDANGQWVPNPHLSMSADEQFRQNVANGFPLTIKPIRL